MKRRYILILVLSWHFASAQRVPRIPILKINKDSIEILTDKLVIDSLRLYVPKHLLFDFQFDNRNSFIRNRAINIQGINPGILIDQQFRWGLGLYRVIAPYQKFESRKASSISDGDEITDRELDMYFIMPNFRYLFINRKWIQTGVELAIGFGAINYSISSEDSFVKKYGTFIPAGGGIETVIIPVRWIGLGGSIGYRKSLKTYDINADFDGMYYSYGVKVFVGLILKDLKYKSLKKHYAEDIRRIRARGK